MPKREKNKLTKEEKRARRREDLTSLKREAKAHPALLFTYFVLRVLVLAVLVRQLWVRDYYNAFLCGLTLVLFLIPSFVERTLHIDVPNTLEVIILLFIFSAEILGEIQEYYLIFPFWDTVLHTMNGFLMAAIGIAMVDILNRSDKFKVRLSPVFVAVVAFCFSMTVGVLWEFFEYGMDQFFHMDMQKDTWLTSISTVSLNPEGKNAAVTIPVESVVVNGGTWPGYLDVGLNDTMKDLLVNFIGAVVFSLIGMLYIMGRGKGKFAPRFIPRLKADELKDKGEAPGLLEPIPLDGGEENSVKAPAELEERFDIYTRDGHLTGRTAVKGTDCTGDDYYIGVHIYLYDGKGRFLMQRRALTKDFLPGEWEVSMGHVMAGETPRGAARRETREELGVDLPAESFIHAARFVWNKWNHIMDVYFARADVELDALKLQEEEVMDAKWVTKAEMASFLRKIDYRPPTYGETVARYLEDAVKEPETEG